MRDGLANHWVEILGPGLGEVNEDVEVGGAPERQLAIKRHYTQNPLIGCRSVSDTWNLVNPVRKIEFELLQFMLISPRLSSKPKTNRFKTQIELGR